MCASTSSSEMVSVVHLVAGDAFLTPSAASGSPASNRRRVLTPLTRRFDLPWVADIWGPALLIFS